MMHREYEFPAHGPHVTDDPTVRAVVTILRDEVTPHLSGRGGSPENFVWVPVAEAIVDAVRDKVVLAAEGLLSEAQDGIDHLLSWIVNDWEWDQADYDRLSDLRNRLSQ